MQAAVWPESERNPQRRMLQQSTRSAAAAARQKEERLRYELKILARLGYRVTKVAFPTSLPAMNNFCYTLSMANKENKNRHAGASYKPP